MTIQNSIDTPPSDTVPKTKINDVDPFLMAGLYRLRRDALFIVSNLNQGRVVDNETMKRQMLFIQSQLCTAAVADPCVSESLKQELLKFQSVTVLENMQDRRGSQRRLML